MSRGDIDELMTLWSAHNTQQFSTDEPPFKNCDDLYAQIDSIALGDIPWESMAVSHSGPCTAPWMKKSFEVWYRDPLKVMEAQLGNPDFCKHIDFAPKWVRDKNGDRQYGDLMSGTWAWNQAVSVPY